MVMDTLRPTVAYLSGSGFPAWYWRDVRHAVGGSSFIVDYLKAGASLDQHAQAILDGTGHTRLILVAHSIGGVVASQVCALEPDRIAGVLGICAAFPPPGRSYLDTLRRRARLATTAAIRVMGTRPPNGVLLKEYRGEVDEAVASRLVADYEQESPQLFLGRLATPRFPETRGYVLTSVDSTMRPELQERYAAQLAAGFRRELATGHLPMLTQPSELASLVKEFVESCPS